MRLTAHDMESVMNNYVGGSLTRYRHPLNRHFIFTEGVNAVADSAGAHWFLDIVATEMAPVYAKAWHAGSAGTGIVSLRVASDSTCTIELSLEDEVPPVCTRKLNYTDFPEGSWNFYLGTDQAGINSSVTTMCLPQEY